jgi:hypothetical protein
LLIAIPCLSLMKLNVHQYFTPYLSLVFSWIREPVEKWEEGLLLRIFVLAKADAREHPRSGL